MRVEGAEISDSLFLGDDELELVWVSILEENCGYILVWIPGSVGDDAESLSAMVAHMRAIHVTLLLSGRLEVWMVTQACFLWVSTAFLAARTRKLAMWFSLGVSMKFTAKDLFLVLLSCMDRGAGPLHCGLSLVHSTYVTA